MLLVLAMFKMSFSTVKPHWGQPFRNRACSTPYCKWIVKLESTRGRYSPFGVMLCFGSASCSILDPPLGGIGSQPQPSG